MKTKLFLKLLIVIALFMGGTQVAHAQSSLPPERPSAYYGEIDFVTGDGEPAAGSPIEAYVPGVTEPVVSSSISDNSGELVYRLKVPADDTANTIKDGGVSGDDVTFKIGERIVAVASASWLDGSMTMINIHPPKASATGPVVAVVGEQVSFSGSAEDTLSTDTFTYAWDLDGDGAFDDSTDQNPTHTYTTAGSYTATLRVRDSQGGEGYASVNVVVEANIITVTATAGQTKVFGTSDPVFAYTYTPSDPSITFTGVLSRVTGDDVGTYAITIGSLAAPDGYTINFVPADFTITPASATINITSSLDLDYNGFPKSVTATTVPADLAYSVTYDGETSEPINTGTYAVSAQITNTNYTASPDTGTLVIRATQTLTLQPGWNLVSFNLIPYPNDPPAIFAGITGNYDLVYAWYANVISNNWLLHDNNSETTDSLTSIEETKGIWIHITSETSQTLEVKGFFPTETSIALVEGWNLVGFPSSISRQTSAATSSLGETFDRLFGYDPTTAESPWLVYDPAVPDYVNDLTDLNPGSGYWIKVTEPVNWVIAYE